MKTARSLLVLVCVLAMTGCYAANIDTGRTPSTKVIRQPWAPCWIYGLIPPPVVKTAAECPDGVARVETQHSFLNLLVGNLTFGIFTPIQIVVTCAEGSQGSLIGDQPEIKVAKDASVDEVRDAFAKAADEAVKSGHAVYVRMDR